MITGNEPVTPVVLPGHVYGDGSSELPYAKHDGLTIRQYFAGLAMQGLCANSVPGPHHKSDFLAMEAVQYADALIAELNKPPHL